MIQVHVAGGLLAFTGGVKQLEVEASSVRQLVNELDARFPGLGERLSHGVSVAINGDIIADALYEPLPANAEVHFLDMHSGG